MRNGVMFCAVMIMVMLSLLLVYSMLVHARTPAPDASSQPSPPSASPSATPSPTAPSPEPVASPTAPARDEAKVMLHHREIITVSADSGHSARERAGIVEERLLEVLQKTDTRPEVRIVIIENTPVIESLGVYIISVTNSDASPLNLTVSELAATWRDHIAKGLGRACLENSSSW